MRISDWSSDVCSSDLIDLVPVKERAETVIADLEQIDALMIFGGRYRGQAAYRCVDRLFEGGTRRDMARRPGADLFGEHGGSDGQHDGIKHQAKQDSGTANHRHHSLGLIILQMNHMAFPEAVNVTTHAETKQ